MRINTKWSIGLMLTISMLFMTNSLSASVTTQSSQKSERTIKKDNKQQNKIHKKVHKIQKRINKAKEKAGVAVLDDAGFLEGADDRVRWGLIGLAGGLLLWLILKAGLAWIGWLAMVVGLGLLVWYLIEP